MCVNRKDHYVQVSKDRRFLEIASSWPPALKDTELLHKSWINEMLTFTETVQEQFNSAPFCASYEAKIAKILYHTAGSLYLSK